MIRQVATVTAARAPARRGFMVALNAPYAGGFTTGHYGRPRHGRHALQIEINRALYMDEESYGRRGAFETVKTHLAELVAHLARFELKELVR